jgi:integrase/recombinase XerD
MNLRPSGLLPPNKAVEGFLYFKIAEGLSESSITSYRYQLNLWLEQMGKFELDQLSSGDLSKYLAWLRLEYRPKRFNKDTSTLSGKTLRNHWVTLRSFFAWLNVEFGVENAMLRIPPPKFKTPPVRPLSKDQISDLLKSCKYKNLAITKHRKSFRMRRPTADRDIASILLLLDTGIRAGEFCALNIGDFEPGSGRLTIKHGKSGGAGHPTLSDLQKGQATIQAMADAPPEPTNTAAPLKGMLFEGSGDAVVDVDKGAGPMTAIIECDMPY